MAKNIDPWRSWMIVPAHDTREVARCREIKPDVVVLDLEYSVPPKSKEAARSGLADIVKKLGESQAQVFVRIDRETRWADVSGENYTLRGRRGLDRRRAAV